MSREAPASAPRPLPPLLPAPPPAAAPLHALGGIIVMRDEVDTMVNKAGTANKRVSLFMFVLNVQLSMTVVVV